MPARPAAVLLVLLGACDREVDPTDSASLPVDTQPITDTAHTDPAIDTDVAVDTAAPAPSWSPWKYAGPGGMGAISAVTNDPKRPGTVVAGADVGGLFTTRDGGASWDRPKLGQGKNPLEVHQLVFGPDGTAWAAAAEGLFRSDGLEAWQPVGFDTITPFATDSYTNGDVFAHSVQSVLPDPKDTKRLWIGLGRSNTPMIYRPRAQPWHVYRTDDAGTSWDPMLSLPGAHVFSLAVDPDDTDRVWAATTLGLYHTPDAGLTWVELGVASPRVTTDRGDTWESCATSAACPAEIRAASCSTADETCLPIIASAGETHPNLRGLHVWEGEGPLRLYAGVWDQGYATVTSGCNSSGAAGDSKLARTRGGPWVSEDGGITWRWMLRDSAGNAKITSVVYRCRSDVSGTSTTTFMPWVEADPADPEHVLIGAYGSNAGLYEISATGGSWASDPSTVRIEDGLPNQGLTGSQLGPWVIGMDVDWAAGAVYVAHSRGVLRATPGDGGWDMDLLASDVTVDGDVTRWRGTGLEDTCVLSLAEHSSGDLFLGVADGGVLRSEDGGESWADTTDGWPVRADDTYAMLAEGDTIYATNHEGRGESVLRSLDGGDTWALIGGYPGAVGGLDSTARYRHLASVPGGLLLGTSGDGLHRWDGASWLKATSCPVAAEVEGIAVGDGFAFVAFDDASSSKDGVWAYDLETGACTRLDPSASCSVCNPSAVGLARSEAGARIVVAGNDPITWRQSVWTRPFTGALDANAPWTLAVDPATGIDPADPWRAVYVASADKRVFSAIAVDPSDPSFVVATLAGNPWFDGYAAPHAWTSRDAGLTWAADTTLVAGLPSANLYGFVFSPSGDTRWALGNCTSAFKSTFR